jgi:hypothetical protein
VQAAARVHSVAADMTDALTEPWSKKHKRVTHAGAGGVNHQRTAGSEQL